MPRPIKGTEKQNEVISWKCTRELKETVTALASYRNLNVPDLLTTLILEAAEKDREGVEAMKKLEAEAAVVMERIAQARAAVRENPAASISLQTQLSLPATSFEPVLVEDTNETGDETGGVIEEGSESGGNDSNAGKKKRSR